MHSSESFITTPMKAKADFKVLELVGEQNPAADSIYL